MQVLNAENLESNVMNTWFHIAMQCMTASCKSIYFMDTSFFDSYVITNVQGPMGCRYNSIPKQFLIANTPIVSVLADQVYVFVLKVPPKQHWICIQIDVTDKCMTCFNPGDDVDVHFYANSLLMLMDKHVQVFYRNQWNVRQIRTSSNVESGIQVCFYGCIIGSRQNADQTGMSFRSI